MISSRLLASASLLVAVALAGCSSSDDSGSSNSGAPAGQAGAAGSSSTGGAAGDAGSGGGSGEAGAAGGGAAGASGMAGAQGTPKACKVTCTNKALNHEMGCDDCIKAVCAKEYTACVNDKGGGTCIGCGDTGSGIVCSGSEAIEKALFTCLCKTTTCN